MVAGEGVVSGSPGEGVGGLGKVWGGWRERGSPVSGSGWPSPDTVGLGGPIFWGWVGGRRQCFGAPSF